MRIITEADVLGASSIILLTAISFAVSSIGLLIVTIQMVVSVIWLALAGAILTHSCTITASLEAVAIMAEAACVLVAVASGATIDHCYYGEC